LTCQHIDTARARFREVTRRILPRDAVLARYFLSSSVCLSARDSCSKMHTDFTVSSFPVYNIALYFKLCSSRLYGLFSFVSLFVCCAMTLRPAVCHTSYCYAMLCYVCSSQAESSWFLARRLSSICPTLCCKEISVSPKLGSLPLELCPKLRT